MDFISTRGGSAVSAGTAILKGIADDGGLYVPSFFPTLTETDFDNMLDMGYPERAAFILSKYLTDYDPLKLLEYCQKAYSRFDGEPAPLIKAEEGAYIMELFHGPTLAFKDVALTLLPYLVTEARRMEGSDKKTLILVATSGDTGKAALEGFKDVEGTEIVVLYPSDGVSELQKLQMKTTSGANTHVIGVEGNFDDAQSAVKAIFADREAAKRFEDMGYALSSANSINFGRLAPQIVYYVSAYVDLMQSGEIDPCDSINFAVPTGNFGNVLAAYYAKKMGVPISRLIVASNKNDVLTDFFHNGRYDVNRRFYKTMSPSMDILISSNLERLLFEAGDKDPGFVKDIMERLKLYGIYNLDMDILYEKLPEFVGYSSDEQSTEDTIDGFFDMFDYVLDPHTAVAVNAYYNYISETGDLTKTVIAATASPYKFARDVLRCLSQKDEEDTFKAVKKLHAFTDLPIPKEIEELKFLPVLHDAVAAKEDIKEAIFAAVGNK